MRKYEVSLLHFLLFYIKKKLTKYRISPYIDRLHKWAHLCD